MFPVVGKNKTDKTNFILILLFFSVLFMLNYDFGRLPRKIDKKSFF